MKHLETQVSSLSIFGFRVAYRLRRGLVCPSLSEALQLEGRSDLVNLIELDLQVIFLNPKPLNP